MPKAAFDHQLAKVAFENMFNSVHKMCFQVCELFIDFTTVFSIKYNRKIIIGAVSLPKIQNVYKYIKFNILSRLCI